MMIESNNNRPLQCTDYYVSPEDKAAIMQDFFSQLRGLNDRIIYVSDDTKEKSCSILDHNT